MLLAITGGILSNFGYVLKIYGTELPMIDWELGIPLAIGGGILFGIGFLMEKKFKEKELPPVELDINNLGFVESALKKTRRRNLIVGIFLILFALCLVGVQSLPDTKTMGTGGIATLWVLCLICLLLGIWMFFQYAKLSNIRGSEIYHIIMLEPQTITRLDAQIFKSGVGKVGQAINATLFVDKKRLTTLSVSETELELLRQYLLRHNPGLDYKLASQTVR